MLYTKQNSSKGWQVLYLNVLKELQFSGSWEACSNLETVTKLKTSECGILSILTKQNKKMHIYLFISNRSYVSFSTMLSYENLYGHTNRKPEGRDENQHTHYATLQHTFWKSSNFFCSTSTCSRSAPTSSFVSAASFSLIHCWSSLASRKSINFLQLFSSMPLRFSPSSRREWYLEQAEKESRGQSDWTEQHHSNLPSTGITKDVGNPCSLHTVVLQNDLLVCP